MVTHEELLTNEERRVYEDAVAVALLPEKGASLGHVQVVPKKKVKSLEELDDDTVVQLFYIASYAATAVFESLGMQGTNIIVNDGNVQGGEDFLVLNVLPRKEGDTLDFKWDPKQLQPQEMESIQKSIKDKADYVNVPDDQKPKEVETKHEFKGDDQINVNDDEENYLIKSLTRIP